MIQVSIGNRSKSPFRPLSFLMISLADLRRVPRDWAVVDAGLGFCFRMSLSLSGGGFTCGFDRNPATRRTGRMIFAFSHVLLGISKKLRNIRSSRSEEHTSELQPL